MPVRLGIGPFRLFISCHHMSIEDLWHFPNIWTTTTAAASLDLDFAQTGLNLLSHVLSFCGR